MPEVRSLPIKTDIFQQGEDFHQFLLNAVKGKLSNGDVLSVSTKVVSINEGRIVSKSEISKKDLVEKESDQFLGEIGYNIFLTIKDGLLIPSAGIDESNAGDGQYLLFPEKPFDSAKAIWAYLKKELQLDQLGVILVDSHTTPLRRGTSGIALSYWGFEAVRDYRGTPDLDGKPLEYTFLNLVDSLAATANLSMGEGNECTPLVITKGVELNFVDEVDPTEIQIPIKEDLYYPFLKSITDKN